MSQRSQLAPRTISILLLLFCVSQAIACGTTYIVRGSVGADFKVDSNESGPAPSAGKTVAILPFMNTAAYSRSGSVDVADMNRKLSQIVWEYSFPEGVKVLPPSETQALISERGLTQQYSRILTDFSASGLVDQKAVRKIMRTLQADVMVQGIIAHVEEDDLEIPHPKEARVDALGSGVVIDTGRRSKKRFLKKVVVNFVVFNNKTGAIDWHVRVTGESVPYDRRTVEENRKTQTIAGAATGVMLLGGTGMMFGSLATVGTAAFWPLLIIGAVVTAVSVGPGIAAGRSKVENKYTIDLRGYLPLEDGTWRVVMSALEITMTRLQATRTGGQSLTPAQRP